MYSRREVGVSASPTPTAPESERSGERVSEADLPPGYYTLRLGMYLAPDGPRLQILDAQNQPAADFIEVGMVEVRS